MPSIVQASASLSTVAASPGTIANDGLESCVVTLTVRDAAGDVVPGVAAAACVLAVSGTGNTVTQPTGVTDDNGQISGSFVSTGAATKSASFTLAGLAITQTQSVVVTGGAIAHPNEPSGYTQFAVWDAATDGMPDATPTDGGAYVLQSPAGLLAIDAAPPSPPSGHASALRLTIQAGTPAGFNQPGGDYSNWGIWDLVSDLSNTEYSEFYEDMYFNAWGYDGVHCETPIPGWKALGYWGSTNNNQNPVTGAGPVQFLNLMMPVDGDASDPMVATTFFPRISTQNGTNVNYDQNMNTGTRVLVGTTHRWEAQFKLNDVGSANGVIRCWLDGVLVVEYTTNIEFINAAFAQYGSTGLSGFFGRLFSIVWGGQGGADMTQDHFVYFYNYYASGVFLRAAAP